MKGFVDHKDSRSTLAGTTTTQNHSQESWGDICGKCGARRIDAQLGLERTPDEYVANLVAVFREVRRVLTDDGTLWLNLGDSYASDVKGSGGGWALDPKNYANRAQLYGARKVKHGLKPKDMVGIPWRVAFALQADGWWLRSDVIWSKPNPMPESVRDRPTKAHEYVFLFSKRSSYYYDADAIAEPFSYKDRRGDARIEYNGKKWCANRLKDAGDVDWFGQPGVGRNARTVWEIVTKPYAQAHFATFPPELPERCIKAGSAPGDTVLDPFGGSGTTASVAVGHGRDSIYIDLNPEYIEMARNRIGPMLCKDAA
jgi:DNA modification methylase